MIGRMARRVNRSQSDAAEIDALPVLQHEIGLEARILALAGRRGAPEHLRAGGSLDRCRGRRMVHVRMRAQDPLDVAEAEDLLDVRGDVRPRVDHGMLVFTHDIGVGAGPGHHPGVRCNQARHPAIELLRLAGDQVVGGGAGLFRVAPVGLEVLRVGAAENLLAFSSEGATRPVLLDLFQRAHMAHRLGGGGEVLQLGERLARRVHQLDLAARAALERLARRDPQRVHHLARIVRALLAVGGARDEKARVEAPCPARRRDPVAAVGELARRQVEVLALQQLDERPAAVMRKPGGARCGDELALRIAGEQDAGFLEALADRGDPVRDRRRRQRKPPHARHDAAIVVGRIERAAREHIGAAEERRALRPLQHQHLRAGRIGKFGIAQQRERRGRPRDHGGHQLVRPARSLSFCALIMARMRSQSASESLSSSVK